MVERKSLDELVVVDVETTGTNPFKHQILSLALVPVDEQRQPLELYVMTDRPTWHADAVPYFERMQSRWREEATDPQEACSRLHAYLQREFPDVVTLVGHNVGFDVAFLRQLAFRAGLDELPLISHRVVDTHTILYVLYLRGVLPKTALTSSGAFEHFGIDVPKDERHTALGDATATRALFLCAVESLGWVPTGP